MGMGFSGGDMPFLEGLATQCSYFTDWAEMDENENSLNQYIGLTSGVKSTTVTNDCDPSATCRSTDDNIFRQVRESGGTPRTYVDGAAEPCSVGDNRAKHIPALYYQGGDDQRHCADEVRPMSDLDPDRLPTLAFIVPDQCHDGHDCDDGEVDAWARSTLEPVLDSSAYQRGEVLVVVIYDEDRPVPNLFIAPTANAGPIDTVASALRKLAGKYTLPMTSGRGYSSLPPRKAMVDRFRASGKEKLIVPVVSDFDPEGLPTLAFIVPDQCHDGHDCDDGQVDAWARSTLDPVLASSAYQQGEVLVAVIYDEDRPVPNLLIAPTAHAGPIDTVVGTHAGLMKTVESALGLAVLDQGQLPSAPDLRTPANV